MENKCCEKLKSTINSILDSMEQNKDSFVMRPGKDFTRNRSLPFSTTLKTILGMHSNSLRKEMIDIFPDITQRPTASALVQQRAKIKPDTFKYVFDQFNSQTEIFDTATYNGYHLYAIDGTALNVAKNENADTYFALGFNQLHLIPLYDICNKTIKDCIIQPRPQMNENAAFKEMVMRNTFAEKSIVIADRLFASYNLYETVNRKENLDYLIRVPNNYSTETRDLPMAEVDTKITINLRTTQTNKDKRDYKAGKAKYIAGKSKFGKPKKDVAWDYESNCLLTMRIVRFKISDNEYETIVTSLNAEDFSAEEIKKLYQMRWGIETAFRELKYGLGLSRFHAIREDFVIQEIYSHLLMYNFSMRIAMHVGLTSSKGKYNYQINFSNALYVCKKYFRDEIIRLIEAEIATCIEPVRPDRTDTRKILPKSFVPFLYRVA